ncbi:hypothetical protein [Streptomyces violaceusniger]|nr:hypothetical protein [Streptomyces hygroscopicus]
MGLGGGAARHRPCRGRVGLVRPGTSRRGGLGRHTHGRRHRRPGGRPRTPRPVVLYSPGLGATRTLGTSTAEELAGRGYVVVTMDHTHETSWSSSPAAAWSCETTP